MTKRDQDKVQSEQSDDKKETQRGFVVQDAQVDKGEVDVVSALVGVEKEESGEESPPDFLPTETKETQEAYHKLTELLKNGKYEAALELIFIGSLKTKTQEIFKDALTQESPVFVELLATQDSGYLEEATRAQTSRDRIRELGRRMHDSLERSAEFYKQRQLDDRSPENRMLRYAIREHGLVAIMRSISDKWKKNIDEVFGFTDMIGKSDTQDKLRANLDKLAEKRRELEEKRDEKLTLGWKLNSKYDNFVTDEILAYNPSISSAFTYWTDGRMVRDRKVESEKADSLLEKARQLKKDADAADEDAFRLMGEVYYIERISERLEEFLN